MIAEDYRQAATRNLVGTYMQLGLATPRAGLWEEDGFRACLGPYPLPICNFAVDLRLDPWSARRLQALAESRVGFHVYAMPGDEPSHVEELLARTGFQRIYELTAMLASPAASEKVSPQSAQDPETRRRIARFMTNQFFSAQDAAFRERVFQATFSANDLELYYLGERGRPTAGLMLSRSNDMLGLYNLCVAPSKRNRGIGASLVHWCLDLAGREKRSVTLQCDPRLEGWYAALGFVSIGAVKVFALRKPMTVDIIDSVAVH